MPFRCKIHHTRRNVSDFGNKLIRCIFMLYTFPFQWPGIRRLLLLLSRCSAVKHETPGGPDSKSTSPMLSHARTVFITPSLCLFLSLPPWWLMANAALVHLYIPLHPFLANRCEILDMAWIWPPGEKGGLDWVERGALSASHTSHTSHTIHIFCFFTFDFLIPWYVIAFLLSYTLKIAHTFTLLHTTKICRSVSLVYSTRVQSNSIGLWHVRNLFCHNSCLVCLAQHVLNR